MKKFISISLALLIVLAGLHVTIATHFCGGEFASTKISVTGKLASCGMESDYDANSSVETIISAHCCENQIAVYSIETNYAPSEFNVEKLIRNAPHAIIIPANFIFLPHLVVNTYTSASPPNNSMVSAVSMADICVFRI